MGKVNGKVIFSVNNANSESRQKVGMILVKVNKDSGVSLTQGSCEVTVKGKNIDTDKILDLLKGVDKSAKISKIEEDVKIHTTVLKFPNLCCDSKAKKIKTEMESYKGIDVVSVDIKEKKVTVKGTMEEKKVLELAGKIDKVELWK